MPTMHIGEQEIHDRERGAGEALLIFPDDIHAAAAYEAAWRSAASSIGSWPA
jgi:hypothetical protein